MGEIVAGLSAQMRQHIAQSRFIRRRARFVRDGLAARRVRRLHIRLGRFRDFRRQLHPILVPHELHQLRRHLRDGQHPIDHPGADRGQRHAVVLRFIRILRDRHPALRADVFQPDRAIRIRPGKNHAQPALPVSLRQGAKEKIDRHPAAQRLLRRDQPQRAVFESQLMIRRNHIDVIRFHLHRLGHLRHRHRRFLLNDRGQVALVFRRKMHHHDKGQPAIRRHVGKELLEDRDPAGRRAQTYDRRGLIRIAPFRRPSARLRPRRIRRRGIEAGSGGRFFGHHFERGPHFLLQPGNLPN